MQQKMYKDAFKEAGFNAENHFAVDIRNMKTSDAVNAIKELVVRSNT